MYISPNAEVHVFGDIQTNGSSSVFEHYGFLQTYQDINNGNFELSNEGKLISTGDMMVKNDWINNGIMLVDSGMVEMYGGTQWFTGDSISRFYDLKLTGTNAKEQDQHIRVQHVLDLTNRELAVHDWSVFIEDSSVSAITWDNTLNSEGIISTDEDGYVIKPVRSSDLNIIPLGSNFNGTFRHRPLRALLMDSGMDTIFATFHQHSPDLLNLFVSDMDTSLCKIQQDYFYTFKPTDTTSHFQLDFAHYPPTDGFYPDLSQWYNPTWKMVYNHTDLPGSDYSYVRANNESDFVFEHYTLGYRTPSAPYMLYDSTECYSTAMYQVEMPLGKPYYQWWADNSDQSAEVIQGQGSNQILLDWNDNIGGTIHVQYEDTAGCWSHETSATIYDVSVQADYSYTHENASGFTTSFQFINESSANTDEIIWNFDGDFSPWLNGSDLTLPYFYNFDADVDDQYYEVTLIAHNDEHACYDTITQTIFVEHIFTFYAPNSFTPNGDGINDTFFGYAEEVTSASMQIFNRWGELIYNAEGLELEELIWDGTYRGTPVQSGTYMYRIVITPTNYNNAEKGVIEFEGHVTLNR